MKKVFLTITALFFAHAMQAQVSFKPGIRTGANYSRFSQIESGTERFKPKTDFYAGVFADLNLSKIYTMTPSLTYTRQGSKKDVITNGIITTSNENVNYIALANISKFRLGKIHIMAGPSIDVLFRNYKKKIGSNGQFQSNASIFNEVDLAIIAGIGYKITESLDLELRIKHSLSGASHDYNQQTTTYPNSSYSKTYGETIDNIVYQLGLAYSFNLKKKEK